MTDLQVLPFLRFQVLFGVPRGCFLGCLLTLQKVRLRCLSGAVWVRAATPITPWAKARLELAPPLLFSV